MLFCAGRVSTSSAQTGSSESSVNHKSTSPVWPHVTRPHDTSCSASYLPHVHKMLWQMGWDHFLYFKLQFIVTVSKTTLFSPYHTRQKLNISKLRYNFLVLIAQVFLTIMLEHQLFSDATNKDICGRLSVFVVHQPTSQWHWLTLLKCYCKALKHKNS